MVHGMIVDRASRVITLVRSRDSTSRQGIGPWIFMLKTELEHGGLRHKNHVISGCRTSWLEAFRLILLSSKQFRFDR